MTNAGIVLSIWQKGVRKCVRKMDTMRASERDSERQRETDRDRLTDRQRQTDRQTETD